MFFVYIYKTRDFRGFSNYYTLCKFFLLTLADGLSLEAVTISLQDSSQYSGQFQQFCNLDGLNSSLNFQLFQLPFQLFGDYSEYDWVSPSPAYSTAFLVLKQGSRTCLAFCFLGFSLCGPLGWKRQLCSKFSLFFFFFIIIRSDLLAEIRWYVCISKSQQIFYTSFSRMDFGLCIYHLVAWANLNFFLNYYYNYYYYYKLFPS